MIRYYKRNAPLFISALILVILTRMSIPAVSVIEQKMVDLIISGDLIGFRDMMLVAGGIVVATALLYFMVAVMQKRFQVRFEQQLREDLFDAVMRLDDRCFTQKDTAEQLSIIKSHSSTISTNFSNPIFTLAGYGVTAVAILGIMFYYSPLLALVSVVSSLISTAAPLYFNKKLSVQLMDKLAEDANVTFQLKEALNAHETVNTFQVFAPIRQRFKTASSQMTCAQYRLEITTSLLENVSQVTQRVTWFISFLIAGSMAINGVISIGTLVMFVSLFSEFNTCITLYNQVSPLLFSSRKNAEQLIKIIDDRKAVFTGTRVPTLKHQVCVRNLSFRYTKELPVIEHLNFNINKGEKIVLIGPSGCGKSTLVKLLSGRYADYEGSIFFDGNELHELDIKKLQKLVVVIQQNTFIFNDTVRFNICLGEPFSDGELQDALRRSGVCQFLSSIPGGLDGSCGENGSRLSGGQKQRIALARALIREVHMLILDEGVAAIDVETANEIEKELLEIKDLTLLTITHRIKDGLIDQYDRIMTMEEGKLREKK